MNDGSHFLIQQFVHLCILSRDKLFSVVEVANKLSLIKYK